MSVETFASEYVTSSCQPSCPFVLGPFDNLVGPSIPIEVVYVYKIGFPATELRLALNHLLTYYPQLTGRLSLNSNDEAYEITHFDQGMQFVEAKCSTPLSSFLPETSTPTVLDLPGQGCDLLPYFNNCYPNVLYEPIFGIQHTTFSCGSVALGVRLHHAVTDAYGLNLLMTHLSDLFRQHSLSVPSPTLSSPPIIQPFFPSTDIDPSYQPDLYSLPGEAPPAVPEVEAPNVPDHKVCGKIITVSEDQVLQLKKVVQGSDSSTSVSSFEALSTFFYKLIHQARHQFFGPSQLSPPSFLTSVDCRSRLNPPLSSSYFHNAVLTACMEMSTEELLNESISNIAEKIHNVTRGDRLLPNEIEKTLQWINQTPSKRSIQLNFRFGNGSLLSSSWTRLSLFDTNFTCRPFIAGVPFTSGLTVDGLIYFLPNINNGVDVRLCLLEPVWEVLENMEEFKKVFG
ncbi:hypothetical protein P9112_003930 [Eukaryota sp. TZLM1-RC]